MIKGRRYGGKAGNMCMKRRESGMFCLLMLLKFNVLFCCEKSGEGF